MLILDRLRRGKAPAIWKRKMPTWGEGHTGRHLHRHLGFDLLNFPAPQILVSRLVGERAMRIVKPRLSRPAV